ncbi:MAG: hypothetical protein ACKOUS_09590, partial [Alphaproteobacteria bacterium]
MAAPGDGARHLARGLGGPAGAFRERGDDMEDANGGGSVLAAGNVLDREARGKRRTRPPRALFPPPAPRYS